MPTLIDDLAVLRADFPAFKIWREHIPGRARYVARSLRDGLNPHTVVTSDLGELREALEPARAAGKIPFTTAQPNIARMYDYWLQGKDHLPGGPRRSRRGHGEVPRGGPDRPSQPGVPDARGAARGQAGHHPVHRSGIGPADQPEHARGRPGSRTRCPGLLRGQRPTRARARPGLRHARRCRQQHVVDLSANPGARHNAGEASYRPEGL